MPRRRSVTHRRVSRSSLETGRVVFGIGQNRFEESIVEASPQFLLALEKTHPQRWQPFRDNRRGRLYGAEEPIDVSELRISANLRDARPYTAVPPTGETAQAHTRISAI
jgi:hypothetical protein